MEKTPVVRENLERIEKLETTIKVLEDHILKIHDILNRMNNDAVTQGTINKLILETLRVHIEKPNHGND